MRLVVRRILPGLLGPAVAVLVAGCTVTVTDPVGVPQPAGSGGAAGTDLGPRSADGGYWPRSVQLGQHPELGPVVLDGQGFTLYRFDNDSSSPPQSTCLRECARQWPPVLVSEKITYQNLNPELIGVVEREDGTQQVTVGGRPLYRFVGDQVPGQILGQGAQETWFVVGPDGNRAAPAPASR